jgi:hypothetical protein
MYDAFQPKPDLTPFARLEARIPLDEMNDAFSYGAAASMKMNLEEADRAPEYELNVILWKAVRGADSVMPPPVRAAFLRPAENDDEEGAGDDRRPITKTPKFPKTPKN